MPPLDQAVVQKAAMAKPMLSAAWQALQKPVDPEAEPEEVADPDAGKFRWDGKFAPNAAVLGAWTTMTMVPAIEAFDPAKLAAHRAPIKEITLKDGGKASVDTLLWSGDTLLDLQKFEALKMTTKQIDGADYLVVEAGGFNANAGKDWKSPLIVFKRKE